MRIALISDPHGNLRALDAVLAEVDQSGPWDEVIMGGDFALGGPMPGQCVDRIRARGWRAVRGNTDEFIVEVATGSSALVSITEERQRHGPVSGADDPRLVWTTGQLDQEQIEYLASLPLQIDIDGEQAGRLTIVHATPWSAHPAIRADASLATVQELFDRANGASALAYGHIHVQYERDVDGRLLAAVGSIGLPFDGDQRAAFAELHTEDGRWQVTFRRVAYDVDSAIQDALSSGNPNGETFAQTLRTARPPGS